MHGNVGKFEVGQPLQEVRRRSLLFGVQTASGQVALTFPV